MKTIDLDTVKRARARAVADPGILIKGMLAVDSQGRQCETTDKNASCFCTVGLIMNEAQMGKFDDMRGPYHGVAVALGLENRYDGIDQTVDRNDKNVTEGEPSNCGKFKRAELAGFDFLISKLEKKAS